jgi:hypothetical protein
MSDREKIIRGLIKIVAYTIIEGVIFFSVMGVLMGYLVPRSSCEQIIINDRR